MPRGGKDNKDVTPIAVSIVYIATISCELWGTAMTTTSVPYSPTPTWASSARLTLLGLAAAVVWIGGNLLLPWLAPTGIPSAVTRLAVHLTILCGLWLGLRRTDFSSAKRIGVWLAVAIPLTLWLVFIWNFAAGGGFRPNPGAGRLPPLPIAIFLPLLVGLPFLLWSRTFGTLLDAVPPSWLVGLQVLRLLGGIFLVNWYNGTVAGGFAWPAGIGDMATGIMALPAALAVASGTASGRRSAFWWNIFGLTDFAVAITMGFLSSPGPFQKFGFDIPASYAGTYPTVMIPAFAVPSWILLHALSLRQLRRARTRA